MGDLSTGNVLYIFVYVSLDWGYNILNKENYTEEITMKKVLYYTGWIAVCSSLITLAAAIYSSSSPVNEVPAVQKGVSEFDEENEFILNY